MAMKHRYHDDLCWIPCPEGPCGGLVRFDPQSTSLFGGGLKSCGGWDLGDPELQHHRYEGRCVECMQFGKFNKVAQ